MVWLLGRLGSGSLIEYGGGCACKAGYAVILGAVIVSQLDKV
jgi:hypothetical protein